MNARTASISKIRKILALVAAGALLTGCLACIGVAAETQEPSDTPAADAKAGNETAPEQELLIWGTDVEPEFCNQACHEPMDPYVEGYINGDATSLVAAHADAGITCTGCHAPTLESQVKEVKSWLAGDFRNPLRTMKYDDSFCLENCHNMTRDDLVEATSDLSFNPHLSRHGDLACSTCHSMHGESDLYCAQCHTEAVELSNEIGWVIHEFNI